ncbi:MAG: hypothetical protein IKW02_01595 [Clostridia bacterium]|nr:hypothetical protein [Clostridia bacterium]
MIELSVTPLDPNHIDEICEDLKRQQDEGVTTHAAMTMYFAPEGNPVHEKAEYQCAIYDKYVEKFEKMGIKHAVMVQSTLGHMSVNEDYPFQHTIGLADGEPHPTVCPYDEGFREYIKRQMAILAQRRPSIIMIDDDVGIVYRWYKGCTCPRHMAELAKLLGREITREELWERVHGTSEEDKRITELYLQTQKDALIGAVKAMREGIDSVDPSIQGMNCTAGNFCEFTEDIAEAFAGKGNPRIVRINNGNYTPAGARWFSKNMLRAATQKEILEGKIDGFLAETDTCPQNRYSTGAQSLHAHYTGTILEGAIGAKHWITRMSAFELSSGKAYREILSRHSGFYKALAELAPQIKPVGCRIPLSKHRDYCLTVPNIFGVLLSPWASCVLERLGFPLYFSGKPGGAVFMDDDVVHKFTDEQLKEFFGGTLIMSGKAAQAINDRGFKDYTGVELRDWSGTTMSGEVVKENCGKLQVQVDAREIVPINSDVKADSNVVHTGKGGVNQVLFPGSTIYKNPLGGTSVVFGGTPDTPFKYSMHFSFLNETRKEQFVKILKESGNLPVYYPGDIDIYMRAGYLPDDTLFCAMFNISLDPMYEITLVLEKPATKIEKLMPDGTRQEVEFYVEDGVTHVKSPAWTLDPVVLFIK